MSPLAVAILRRVTLLALVLAAAVVALPPVLDELGVLGPGVEGDLAVAGRAVEVARAYGATEDQPPFAAAVRELARARDLAAKGKGHEARRAAAASRDRANEAQRLALATRDEKRRRAKAVVDEVGRTLTELEDSYAEATSGLDKASTAKLLALMKSARQTGGSLTLAYEQADYDRVLRDETETRQTLASVRSALRSSSR